MNRSRLSRKLEKQTLKNLVFSIFGIIFILVVLFKFGIPLLLNLSLFISGGKKEESSNKKTSFISPPLLSSEFDATNSAKISILGSASPKQTIDLYVNGDLVDKTETNEETSFSFETILIPGENIINAKAISENGQESKLSENLNITFKSKAPSLEITSPQDGQTYSKDQNSAQIKGTTDPYVRVTINNFWAVMDEKNNFSYSLILREGENEIKITAQDQAGNKTEKIVKVTYYP